MISFREINETIFYFLLLTSYLLFYLCLSANRFATQKKRKIQFNKIKTAKLPLKIERKVINMLFGLRDFIIQFHMVSLQLQVKELPKERQSYPGVLSRLHLFHRIIGKLANRTIARNYTNHLTR